MAFNHQGLTMPRNSSIMKGNPRLLDVTGDKGTARLNVLFKTGIDFSLVDERVAGKICDIAIPVPPGFPKKMEIDNFTPFFAMASRKCNATIDTGEFTIPVTLHVVKNINHDVVIGAIDASRSDLVFSFKGGMKVSKMSEYRKNKS
jgi:hypothetical protein